ncbi:ExeA family protein [Aquabacterium sp.]|uniref:ExeA family protein n=1 Tax=Aquabacterium sp. TaxID=1872578 RepID=UPI002BA36EFF|nr:AAA family ATPase [Aquabacterium sp.]HSW04691.1 AAA family ATPase [Aquabacterium sp.]
MYVQRFGLAHEPFSIAPDPRFLFMSERHREALAHLLFGLQGGGGFVVLTGEIGAGKTTVCRCFLERVPAQCNVAYIFNPRLTDTELLKTICDEFRITVPDAGSNPPTIKHYLDPLNAFLLQAHAQGRNNVLIIDEAQNLSATLLEQLRLLTNLETTERKLLQIILIGQPELREMLARPELAPLAQRVIARYHLQALSEAESEAYIRHRLGVAGFSGALPFDAAALRRIHALARGVPRRINLLCDRALLGAYGGGHASVDKRIVERAAREVFDDTGAAAPAARRRLLLAAALGGVIGATLLAGLGALLQRPAAGTAVAAVTLAGSASAAAPSPGVASASAAAASGAALPAAATDLATLLERLPRDERQAWRALAGLWTVPGAAATEADPCTAEPTLRCHRSVLTLAQIRQLARPGLLVLQDDAGQPAYALLLGLGERSATLRIGDTPRAVTLASLARWWRGGFATLWRAPEGLPSTLGDSHGGPLADWLGTQLKAVDSDDSQNQRPLRERIAAFQLAQGLKADGVAGPMTLMQLNRAAGIHEPRLTMTPEN